MFKKYYFEERYPVLTGVLRKQPFLLTCFKILYYGLPIIMMFIYVAFVIHTARTKGKKTLKKTLIFPAVAFLLVSIFRKVFNKKRPYETYNYEPIINKEKKGRSMPSRHTFSAGIITVTVGRYYPILVPFLWIFTGLIGLTRIVAGVHYLRDVLAAIGLAIAAGLTLKLPFLNKE